MTSLQEIRDRAAAATNGPWHWAGNTDTRWVALCHWGQTGRESVMDFERWGMQSATPRFHVPDDYWMRPAHENVVYAVAPEATSRKDPKVYRADVAGIRHPDAIFLEHSRGDVDSLLGMIDKIRARAESWLDDMAAEDEACLEGWGCPCCYAREVLAIVEGSERAPARPVAVVQVAGEVL